MGGKCSGSPRLLSSNAWKRWVLPYVGRYGRSLAAALVLGVLSVGFAAALMYTSGYLISGSAEVETILALHLPLLFVRIFGIGKPVVRYTERLASHNWVLRMTSSMRLQLFVSLAAERASQRVAVRTGDVLGLLADDIGHLQNLYLRSVFPAVIAWICYAVLIAAFGALSPWMALAILLTVGIIVIVLPLVSVCVNGAREMQAKHLKANLYADLTDNVLGIADWMYAGRAEDYLNRFSTSAEKLSRVSSSIDRLDRVRSIIVEATFTLAVLAVVVWAGSTFGGQEGGPSNWIAAFALGVIPLIDAFAPASVALEETFVHRDSLERLGRLPDADPERALSGTPDAATSAIASLDGASIELSHVTFAYPDEARFALRDVTLFIPAGQKLALLGRSGAGKTTLASLIRGDASAQNGTVRVGGVDPTLEAHATRRLVGFVEQNPYVFHDTVRENVRIGRPQATDEEIDAVLRAVGLHDRVSALPQGLDTLVGEDGYGFSGGERHRLSLARVLLLDTPIVILDEPFAGLDPAMEHAIIDAFFEALRDRTVVLITHHLVGAERADRIVYLEDGRIRSDEHGIWDGTAEDLSRRIPAFARLLAFDRGE